MRYIIGIVILLILIVLYWNTSVPVTVETTEENSPVTIETTEESLPVNIETRPPEDTLGVPVNVNTKPPEDTLVEVPANVNTKPPEKYTAPPCIEDSSCKEGYRCDEMEKICVLSCTNSVGELDLLATDECSYGYYNVPWQSNMSPENGDLYFKYNMDNKILQVKNPYYGSLKNKCKSDNSDLIVGAVNRGEDIEIKKREYNSYFGGDPCDGKFKYLYFDYRYVPQSKPFVYTTLAE